jgi:DNA invertase Pin-like site-specific DNA recombinase
MNKEKNITVIPATIDRYTLQPIDQVAKRRTAAYARVSTDSDEQLTSYEAQVEYYAKHIQANPAWEFVGVYADEAVTGTNTKRRYEFNRMVEDALAGKIDFIITKSVSRFARDIVATVQTVRDLKAKGVEVYFEKENLYTFDPKTEMLLSIMASIAQEESRSISENVTWGQRKRMADGKVSFPYKRFLGYEKGEDGTPKIVENEAKTVRKIYALFLEGRTFREIAELLTADNIPTPAKKFVWSMSTVKSILQNEKYTGNAILQKKYTVDFLTKKQKVNKGEVPQYYVENSHPAIISPSVFEVVQGEIRRRKAFGKQISVSGVFVGKLACGQCGALYGAKVWHSNDKYRRTVWRCNRKYDGEKCGTPHLFEQEIHGTFIWAWNTVLSEKEAYIAEYTVLIDELSNTKALDQTMADLIAQCAEASALVDACIAENARHPQNQAAYQKRYDKLVARYDSLKAGLQALSLQKQDYLTEREKIRRFLNILQKEETPLTAFDERLWRDTVELVTVNTPDDISVRFQSGTEIRVGIKEYRGICSTP